MQCTTDVTPVYVTARPMDYWIARAGGCEKIGFGDPL